MPEPQGSAPLSSAFAQIGDPIIPTTSQSGHRSAKRSSAKAKPRGIASATKRQVDHKDGLAIGYDTGSVPTLADKEARAARQAAAKHAAAALQASTRLNTALNEKPKEQGDQEAKKESESKAQNSVIDGHFLLPSLQVTAGSLPSSPTHAREADGAHSATSDARGDGASSPSADANGTARPLKKVLQFQESKGTDAMLLMPTPAPALATAKSKPPDNMSLCVEMLMSGHVNSFVDFFYLTHRSSTKHGTEADKESVLSSEPLSFIKENLTAAESAHRKGEAATVFESYEKLADYFNQATDYKTAIYFYEKCQDTAEQLNDAEKQAKATLNLGLTHDTMGDISSATKFLEANLHLVNELQHKGSIEDAHHHLVEVYRRHAAELEGRGEFHTAIEFYKKCLTIASKLKDPRSNGQALYRLGLAYRSLGDPKQAVDCQQQYLSICQKFNDQTGEGAACAALAGCHQDMGDIAAAVKHLEDFLSISTKANNLAGQAEACTAMGAIFTAQGDHKKALTLYEKAFEIARSLGERKLIESARMNLGVAAGKVNLANYMEIVNGDISTLLKWKTRRTAFKKTA